MVWSKATKVAEDRKRKAVEDWNRGRNIILKMDMVNWTALRLSQAVQLQLCLVFNVASGIFQKNGTRAPVPLGLPKSKIEGQRNVREQREHESGCHYQLAPSDFQVFFVTHPLLLPFLSYLWILGSTIYVIYAPALKDSSIPFLREHSAEGGERWGAHDGTPGSTLNRINPDFWCSKHQPKWQHSKWITEIWLSQSVGHLLPWFWQPFVAEGSQVKRHRYF